jgi:hypothetical protein
MQYICITTLSLLYYIEILSTYKNINLPLLKDTIELFNTNNYKILWSSLDINYEKVQWGSLLPETLTYYSTPIDNANNSDLVASMSSVNN